MVPRNSAFICGRAPGIFGVFLERIIGITRYRIYWQRLLARSISTSIYLLPVGYFSQYIQQCRCPAVTYAIYAFHRAVNWLEFPAIYASQLRTWYVTIVGLSAGAFFLTFTYIPEVQK